MTIIIVVVIGVILIIGVILEDTLKTSLSLYPFYDCILSKIRRWGCVHYVSGSTCPVAGSLVQKSEVMTKVSVIQMFLSAEVSPNSLHVNYLGTL